MCDRPGFMPGYVKSPSYLMRVTGNRLYLAGEQIICSDLYNA